MKWISVEDRLPEFDIPVLTYDKDFPHWLQPLMLFDSGDGWIWAGLESYSHNIADKDNYVCDDEYLCTHWMPLPDPPLEENPDI